MSRSRRPATLIGKRSDSRWVKPDPRKIKEFILRCGRRAMIAQGLIMDPATRPERYSFTWEYEGQMGTVYADNKGDARALIKQSLGISKNKRLPQGVRIVRAHNIEHVRQLGGTHENLRALAGKSSTSECDGREPGSPV